MKKPLVISFLFFLFFSLKLYAQLPKKTDGVAIKAIISEIASDSYKGRNTGSPEGIKTEEYFAAQFKKLGLKPVGENGTYFHQFKYSDYDVRKSELSIEDRNFVEGWDLDFTPMYYSDGGEAEGEIVFAGFGIIKPELERNDFDSIDIKDKIVLIRRGCPDNDFDKWGKEAVDSVKCLYCYNQGAKAVLLFDPIDYNYKQLRSYNNWIAEYDVIKNFPILKIKEHMVRFILHSTKSPYYRIMNKIDFQNVSFNTGKKAKLKLNASTTKGHARNVLAMLPGNDPKLKNEYIIIGGHMDHIGLNRDGEICNGADDNASGVAVTLGIAQAMVKNKLKPKRSIIFACWTGEEMGLLGSKAWCKNPTINLYKTVVYFNLDMIGLGDGNLNMPGTLYAPEVTAFIKEHTDTVTLKKINWSEGGLGGSDHNYFLMKGVPAFAGMTSGDHPDYHRPGDDADKIQADILQFVGDFIYHSTELLAMSKQNFISQKRFEENTARLKSINWYSSMSYGNFIEIVEKAAPGLAVIDFSDGLNKSPDENFIAILKNYEKTEKLLAENEKLAIKTNARDIVSIKWYGGNKTAIVPFLKLYSVGYNELYMKALAKYGFRMASLDENFMSYSDTATREKVIECANNNQIGLVLENQDLKKLRFVLEKSKCPILIFIKTGTQLDDKVTQTIKEKGHLVVLQISDKNSVEEVLKNLEDIEQKVDEKQVAIDCDLSSTASIEHYKKTLISLEEKLGDLKLEELTYDHFSKFMTRSLQEYPSKVIWR